MRCNSPRKAGDGSCVLVHREAFEQLPRRRREAAEIGEVLAALTLVDGGVQLEANEVLSRWEVDLKPTVGADCRSSFQTGRQPELSQAGRAVVEP